MDRQELLTSMYQALSAYFGEFKAPAYDSPFDAALGISINLTPETFDKAKKKFLLNPETLLALSVHEIEHIFPSTKKGGTKKANIVRGLLDFFLEYSSIEVFPSTLSFLQDMPTNMLQEKLTKIRGIGKETADSILLYALDRPVFVTSSAIYRILYRHGLVFDGIEHKELQDIFMDVLPKDCSLYKQFGILLSSTARNFCKMAKPLCKTCPLNTFLEYDPVD